MCVLQCFAVRSLGWVEISEEEMAPGRSSVAVNNCIRQLSYQKQNLDDTAGIWGEVCVYVWKWLKFEWMKDTLAVFGSWVPSGSWKVLKCQSYSFIGSVMGKDVYR